MTKRSKKEKVLEALIETDTITGAANLSGVSTRTIFRYLQDPLFVSAYNATRRQMVDKAVSRIQKLTDKAASTLERNLDCSDPAVETRTAKLIFETALKGVELNDILARLEALENNANQK